MFLRARRRPDLRSTGWIILGAKQWLAAVVSVEQEEQTEERVLSQHQELIPFSVRQLIEDHLKEAYRFVLFNSTAGLTLVAALDEEEKGTGIIDQLEDICKECRKILEVTVTIGVGHRCSDLGHLSVSCQSAVDALGYKAIVGAGKTIYINDVEPVGRGRLQMDVKDESELINAVKFGPRIKSVGGSRPGGPDGGSEGSFAPVSAVYALHQQLSAADDAAVRPGSGGPFKHPEALF